MIVLSWPSQAKISDYAPGHIGVIACPSNCCGTHKFISLCDVENLNVACGLILTKHAFLRVGYCLFRLLAVTMSHVWKLLCFCRWL